MVIAPLVVTLFVHHRAVAMASVLMIVSDRIVVFQSLFHLNDVKRIMMDVMNVLFLVEMRFRAQNERVFGKVLHRVLSVNQVMC